MKKVISATAFMFVFCNLHSQESLKLYEDGQLTGKYYFNEKGLMTKEIAYNVSNNERDTLFYSYFGNDLHSIKLRGTGNVVAFDEDREVMFYRDLNVQIDFLNGHHIVIPLSRINGSIVSDISNVFSIADSNFVEKQNGRERTITFDSIYSNIRFYPSDIERFIVPNTVLNKYKLVLMNDTIQSETYIFDGGILRRRYNYKNGKLKEILSECRYSNDKKIYRANKRFKW